MTCQGGGIMTRQGGVHNVATHLLRRKTLLGGKASTSSHRWGAAASSHRWGAAASKHSNANTCIKCIIVCAHTCVNAVHTDMHTQLHKHVLCIHTYSMRYHTHRLIQKVRHKAQTHPEGLAHPSNAQ